jgi:ankyrin repeat protein
MTPLMYAVKESKTTFLERLIDLGSDVTIRNNVSTTFIIFIPITLLFSDSF